MFRNFFFLLATLIENQLINITLSQVILTIKGLSDLIRVITFVSFFQLVKWPVDYLKNVLHTWNPFIHIELDLLKPFFFLTYWVFLSHCLEFWHRTWTWVSFLYHACTQSTKCWDIFGSFFWKANRLVIIQVFTRVQVQYWFVDFPSGLPT